VRLWLDVRIALQIRWGRRFLVDGWCVLGAKRDRWGSLRQGLDLVIMYSAQLRYWAANPFEKNHIYGVEVEFRISY